MWYLGGCPICPFTGHFWQVQRKDRIKWGDVCCCCSVVSDSATPWTVACQTSLSMGFPRQEYWSRLPHSSPGNLSNPGIKPATALQADSLPLSPWEPPGRSVLIPNLSLGPLPPWIAVFGLVHGELATPTSYSMRKAPFISPVCAF